MAFKNLFASLSAVSEDVRSSCQPGFKHMNKAENGQRGTKRKWQNEKTGWCRKSQHLSNQTAGVSNAKEGMKAEDDQMHMTNNEYKHAGFKREVEKNNRDKLDVHNIEKGQTKNTRQVNKQQQKTKKRNHRHLNFQTNGQNQHHQTKRAARTARTARTGGRGGRGENMKREFPKKRFMTQEFKEQNALEVDGRLLCQHFLWGKCIKGDLCQLEHVQGYNGLIKEVCKFYVQGFCLKGASCPYMHNSFPCRFFHKYGKCSREDCRFSHEPLTEVTEKLLDEAIKRTNDLIELAKKAEEESAGLTENTQESEKTQTNPPVDLFRQPLRPQFYCSSEMNTEKETDHSKDLVQPTEDDPPTHLGDEDQPHNSPPQEPVCYSVEAVLGPQLFKPFHCLFTTPSSDSAKSSPNQVEAPYSVSAVLRSFKAGASESFSLSCEPPNGQTLKTQPKPVSDPTPCSEKTCEPLYFQEKTHKSKQVNENLRPGLTVGCGDSEKGGDVAESQRSTSEVKSQMHVSASAGMEGGAEEGPVSQRSSSFTHRKDQSLTSVDAADTDEPLPSSCFTQTSTPKPHLSVSTSILKPFWPSSIFRESKINLLTSKQDVRTHQNLNDGAQRYHPRELKCRNSRPNKTPTTSFQSLFATPIANTLQPGPRASDQSGFPAVSEPEDNHDQNDNGNTPATSFISLFASPLRESGTSLPHVQSQSSFFKSSSCFREANQPSDRASHSSDPKPVPDRITARSCHQTRSPTHRKNNRDSPVELIIQPKKELANSAWTSDSHSETSKSQPPQTQMKFSSHKDKAASSVLKSLFLHLSPYQQDGPQQGSVPSECVFKEHQNKGRRKAKGKKSEMPSVRSSAPSSVTDQCDDQPWTTLN